LLILAIFYKLGMPIYKLDGHLKPNRFRLWV
jgi:hypothetical protein